MVQRKDSPRRFARWIAAIGLSLAISAPAGAHVYIFNVWRVGSAPAYDGSGWIGEAFLHVPDENATTLLAAEAYILNREPDFTFRTEWIDFPAGPVDVAEDTSFATMGDFLNDYIFDVSDPTKLDEPFGNFVLRFSGYLRVRIEDSSLADPNLPAWVEFGTSGYDGYRVRVHDTVYRLPVVDPNFSFYFENCIVETLGMYPIQVTYFNRFDPDNTANMNRAGIELYSWHTGGLPWPAGNHLIHPVLGPATIVPPRVIYQEEDLLPLIPGDFDAQHDVDLRDMQWLQNCFTGSGDEKGGFFLNPGCDAFDFDDDDDVEWLDAASTVNVLTGPAGP